MHAPSAEPSGSALPQALQALLPQALRPLCEALTVARQSPVFHAGAVPRHLYFVVRGEVVLERLSPDGSRLVLQRTRQGFVSEASLEVSRYHCDALTTVDSELLRLPVPALRTALSDDVAFARRWIAMLNREVRRLRQQCERLTLKSAADRLLHLIHTEGTGNRLEVPSGLRSVSDELGITHEALYRTVAKLEAQGRLRRQAGSLEWVGGAAEPGAAQAVARGGGTINLSDQPPSFVDR